jgi:hypothetical protein
MRHRPRAPLGSGSFSLTSRSLASLPGRFSRGRSFLLLSPILLSFALFPARAISEDVAWDQARVTALAGQLSEQVKALRSATRKEPQVISASNASKQRATSLYLDTLKKLDRTSGKLARQLTAGEDREQTVGTARRIDSLLRDARDQGRKLYTTDWTTQHIEPLASVVAELRTFYSAQASGPKPKGNP